MGLYFINKADCKPLILEEGALVSDALRKINTNSGLPCLIESNRGRLVGLLTDGDIRRVLLETGSLEARISGSHRGLVTEKFSTPASIIQFRMREQKIRHLPTVNEKGTFTGMWVDEPYSVLKNSVGPALLLAGGKGERLRPLTLELPKPLLSINGFSLLERSIRSCEIHGFREIFVSVNYMADKVKDHLKELDLVGTSVEVIEEDEALGTAGPVALVKHRPDAHLLVMNADVLHTANLSAMLEFHESNGADITVASRIFQTTIPFGVLEVTGTALKSINEKPRISHPVSAGIYFLGREARTLARDGQPMDMPDLIRNGLNAQLSIHSFMIHEYWLDVGTPEALELARLEGPLMPES